jgi:hypothetical protein
VLGLVIELGETYYTATYAGNTNYKGTSTTGEL